MPEQSVKLHERFKFPPWYPESARDVFFERLCHAEELGMPTDRGSPALEIAIAEGKAELDASVRASGLTPAELEARKAAGLPVDFPRGLADQALHAFSGFGLKCLSVEPRTRANFPPPPPKEV